MIILAALDTIIIDELHALAPNKRGDLLALGLARLARLAPKAKRLGLSATVADKQALRRFLTPQDKGMEEAQLIEGTPGRRRLCRFLDTPRALALGQPYARHAMADVLAAIEGAATSLVFVNTRSQAEMVFRELWALNESGLEIALHHGSLAPERRRKVEGGHGGRSLACRRLHLDARFGY